jgi:hypothetical protein
MPKIEELVASSEGAVRADVAHVTALAGTPQ